MGLAVGLAVVGELVVGLEEGLVEGAHVGRCDVGPLVGGTWARGGVVMQERSFRAYQSAQNSRKAAI